MADPAPALTALAAALAPLDEAVLVSLANRGLYKRALKDLEAGAAGTPIVQERAQGQGTGQGTPQGTGQGTGRGYGQAVRVTVGAHAVLLGPGGPGQARCDCPAPGMCSHILTATLATQAWLATLAAAGEDGATATAAEAADPLVDVLGWSDALLLAWAGKGAWRQALRMIEPFPDIAWQQGATLCVTLPAPGVQVHLRAGAGPDGILSKAPESRRKATHLAAVLALRRAHGLAVAVPGEDPSAEGGPIRTLNQDDRALLARAAAWAESLVTVGLAHLSADLVEQGLDLSFSAAADRLPRLARELAGLAELSARMIAAQAAVTDAAVLIRAARLLALADALLAAQTVPPGLVGQVRGRYLALDRVTLVPLGYAPWITASGVAGTSVPFWAPQQARAYGWSDVVMAHGGGTGPEATRRFLARADLGHLPGVGAVDSVAGHGRILVTQARATADGRLSLGGQAQLRSAGAAAADDLAAVTVATWAELGPRAEAARAVGLHMPGPLAGVVVVRPAALGPAVADLAEQRVDALACDDGGAPLTLRVHSTQASGPRCRGLMRLAAVWRPGDRLSGYLRVQGAAVTLDPVALLPTDPARPALSLDALGRLPREALTGAAGGVAAADGEADRLEVAAAAGGPASRLGPVAAAAAGVGARAAGGERLVTLLAAIDDHLVRLAVAGPAVVQPRVRADLAEAAAALQALGLTALAGPAAALATAERVAPALLLRLVWLVELARQLSGAAPGDADLEADPGAGVF